MHGIRRTGLASLGALAIGMVAAGAAHAADRAVIARGGYLVNAMGCSDCHTPMKMGPDGPAPDLARGLSGHPEAMALPPAPAASGPWVWGGAGTNTAFWGPWGVSYASNLTPHKESGIGTWKADAFVMALRTGKHLGVGRPILPPMPWRPFGHLDDGDLRAMFAYLQSQPAIANRVPPPVPAAR